jgi:hypothetical protein
VYLSSIADLQWEATNPAHERARVKLSYKDTHVL